MIEKHLPSLFGMQIKLSEQVDNYLLETLNAKKGEITSQEDLKNYSFICPLCKKRKKASQAILLTDGLKFKHEPNTATATISQKVLLVCRRCRRKFLARLIEARKGGMT
jgi:hypothetical protein